ncbi:MAG: 2Fe-2S iron-sulfur cluster-binding protein [Actinomycetota bacterium]
MHDDQPGDVPRVSAGAGSGAAVPSLELDVDGRTVTVPDRGDTLLGVLRDELGITGPKDGCSPQGQCGCCTVLVDGRPRVACVTPARRVVGRPVTTIDGLDPDRRQAWADAFTAAGASQCGFCTPGIITRLDALAAGYEQSAPPVSVDVEHTGVDKALLAHLCRCTGWQTITEAWDLFRRGRAESTSGTAVTLASRNSDAAARRAEIEGAAPQAVGSTVALGQGGFAADSAPDNALVAVQDGDGWAVGETLAEARAAMGKVQGRRTTAHHQWPLDVPAGPWDATLRTTWVEPAYLETDASWCAPGGEPFTTLANGGAFGAKRASPVAAAARELADRHGRSVLVLASREDVTRWGPKRPPVAGGATADGRGILRVVSTPGIVEAVAAVAPGVSVEEITVPGPPTSAAIRAAGWAEASVLLAGARGVTGPVTAPNGAVAEAEVSGTGIDVRVRCGEVLDEVVLRSYCIGAAHMAWSWVTNEALTVDPDGTVHDLTIRSFGVARAIDTPPIRVEIDRADSGPPINGSDAVFAAVAAAVWLAGGTESDWPTGYSLS